MNLGEGIRDECEDQAEFMGLRTWQFVMEKDLNNIGFYLQGTVSGHPCLYVFMDSLGQHIFADKPENRETFQISGLPEQKGHEIEGEMVNHNTIHLT